MDALTLLLIIDMCNREHEVTDQLDKPAIYQPYKETYPYIVSPAVLDQHSDCYAYKKPSWVKLGVDVLILDRPYKKGKHVGQHNPSVDSGRSVFKTLLAMILLINRLLSICI